MNRAGSGADQASYVTPEQLERIGEDVAQSLAEAKGRIRGARARAGLACDAGPGAPTRFLPPASNTRYIELKRRGLYWRGFQGIARQTAVCISAPFPGTKPVILGNKKGISYGQNVQKNEAPV